MTTLGLPVLFLLCLGLAACGQPQPIYVTLVVDGKEQLLQIVAPSLTVRDLLQRSDVTLGSLDRVDPDLYVQVADGMRVVVVRVQETFVTERQSLPFARHTMRNEGLAEGEHRLLQAGTNGEEEITYQLTLEDGIEVTRKEVRREVVVQPVDEIVLVGVQGELPTVPISGTVAYLSGGNAWLMRMSTDLRRNITGSGDLDGRVFALSPDGTRLLFTRGMVGDVDTPLNALWLARTSLVGEEPEYLGVTGVIWAAWSPDGTRLAYSTAERTGGVPGWRAKNDLWFMTLPEEGSGAEPKIERLLPDSAEMPYAWWGRSYAWSPDGQKLAYAQADQVGLIIPPDPTLVPLVSFVPFNTQSHWAWVPTVSWSPDAYLLATVLHDNAADSSTAEDSPIFGMWAISADGRLQVRLAEEAGMWSAPNWAPAGDGLLAYGRAQSPHNSQDSRYDLYVADRDGSNSRRLFPTTGLMGLISPETAWSPNGDALIVEYEANLYRIDATTGRLDQLTSDGNSSHARWAR
jgi:hypothetical protein